MPRPPHICTCGATVPHGVICQCKRSAIRARNRRHDANRPTAAQRGYNSRWRKARAAFLKRNPICAWPRCGAKATTVDHIIAHRGDDKLFWDQSNWQPLCAPCHNRRKQRVERM